jgi:hypothetical protein
MGDRDDDRLARTHIIDDGAFLGSSCCKSQPSATLRAEQIFGLRPVGHLHPVGLRPVGLRHPVSLDDP